MTRLASLLLMLCGLTMAGYDCGMTVTQHAPDDCDTTVVRLLHNMPLTDTTEVRLRYDCGTTITYHAPDSLLESLL